MEDLKKIRLMTNLAIYDKKYGEEDREITSLYRRDYVYRKNLSMRIGVVLGIVLIIGFYYVYRILVAEDNIFEMFSRPELIKIGIYSLIAIVLYSIIGMVINGQRYDIAEERCERYDIMLSKLHGEVRKVGEEE